MEQRHQSQHTLLVYLVVSSLLRLHVVLATRYLREFHRQLAVNGLQGQITFLRGGEIQGFV